MECALEFYCCALISSPNLRTVAKNLACWRQPMTPSLPAGRTSQLTHDYSVTVGEHKHYRLSEATTVVEA